MQPKIDIRKSTGAHDLASPGSLGNQSGVAAPARVPIEPEIVDSRVWRGPAATVETPAKPGPGVALPTGSPATYPVERASLFGSKVADEFQARWNEIQVGFVDDPRASVERADNLVSEVTRCLTESFVAGRRRLESEWEKGSDSSTESLREALQHYHSFFDRLLSSADVLARERKG